MGKSEAEVSKILEDKDKYGVTKIYPLICVSSAPSNPQKDNRIIQDNVFRISSHTSKETMKDETKEHECWDLISAVTVEICDLIAWWIDS
jgi:hypothetical protein